MSIYTNNNIKKIYDNNNEIYCVLFGNSRPSSYSWTDGLYFNYTEYVPTTDVEVDPQKTYYTISYVAYNYDNTNTPIENDLYDDYIGSIYFPTSDATRGSGTYYKKTYTAVQNPVATDMYKYYEKTLAGNGLYEINVRYGNRANFPSTVIIPGRYSDGVHGFRNTYIAEYAFYNIDVYNITINNNVDYIANNAFSAALYTDITSLRILNKNIAIRPQAFFKRAASNIYFGDSTTTISDWMTLNGVENIEPTSSRKLYINNSLVTSVTIPNNITKIKDNTFYGCTDITSLSFDVSNSTCIDIGDHAFYKIGISSLTLPNSIDNIGTYAFSNCMSLQQITLNNGLLVIGTHAFENDRSLTGISIPNTVTSIGEFSFESNISLASINFNNNTNITRIAAGTFSSCISLNNVVVPDSVQYIDKYAFSSCTALTNITLPSNLIALGDLEEGNVGVFANCSNLTHINIPDSVQIIGYMAFTYSGLTTISLPNVSNSSTLYIGAYAFAATQLTNVYLPSYNVSIGDYAFANIGNFNLYFIGSESDWNAISKEATWANNSVVTYYYNQTVPSSNLGLSFVNTRSVGPHYIIDSFSDPNNAVGGNTIQINIGQVYDDHEHGVYPVTAIDSDVFYDTMNITSVIIPNNITSIGARAFKHCINLTSVTLSCNQGTIPANMFETCTSLTTVTIGSGTHAITEIGSEAFKNCVTLSSISMPTSLLSIGESAFFDCRAITELALPNGLTSIGNTAFYNCEAMTQITVPNSVTSIGSSIIAFCKNIVSISVPFIGPNLANSNSDTFDYLFASTNVSPSNYYKPNANTLVPVSLKNVTITNTALTSIVANCFKNYQSVESINIPSTITSIGNNAFRGCLELSNNILENLVLTNIGSYAFYDCMNLRHIELHLNTNNLEISDYAFNISDTVYDGYDNLAVVLHQRVQKYAKSIYIDSNQNIQLSGKIIFKGSHTIRNLNKIYLDRAETYTLIYNSSANARYGNLLLNNELLISYYVNNNRIVNLNPTIFFNTDYVVPACAFMGADISKIILTPELVSLERAAFYLSSASVVELSDTKRNDYHLTSIGNQALCLYSDSSNTANQYIELPNSITSIGASATPNYHTVYFFGDEQTFNNISGSANVTSYGNKIHYITPGLSFISATYNGQYHNSSTPEISGYAVFGYSPSPAKTATTVYIPEKFRNIDVISIQADAFRTNRGMPNSTDDTAVNNITTVKFATANTECKIRVIGPHAFARQKDTIESNKNSVLFEFNNANNIEVIMNNAFMYVHFAGDFSIPDSILSEVHYAAFLGSSFQSTKGILLNVKHIIPDSGNDSSIFAPSTFHESCNIYYLKIDKLETGCVIDSTTSLPNLEIIEISKDVVTTNLASMFKNISNITDVYYEGNYGTWSTITNNPFANVNVHYIESGLYHELTEDSFYDPDTTADYIQGNTYNDNDPYNFYIIETNIESEYGSAKMLFVPANGSDNNFSKNPSTIYIPSAIRYKQHQPNYTVYENSNKIGNRYVSVKIIGDDTRLSGSGKYSYTTMSSGGNLRREAVENELNDIYIPTSITRFDENIFRLCGANLNVHYLGSAESWCNIDNHGALLLRNIITAIPNATNFYLGNTKLTSLALENCVVKAYSFASCDIGSLSFTLYNSQNLLQEFCFAYMRLTSVHDLFYTKQHMFENCTALQNVNIINSESVVISPYTFFGCSGLISITIPSNIGTIGQSAFSGCSSLTTMTIPFVGGSKTATTSSSSTVFGYIFGTTSYTGSSAISQEYDFTTSSVTATYYIPTSLRSITVTGGNILHGAFNNCNFLTSVVISPEITDLGDAAFKNCTNLQSVTLPSTITRIGGSAFYGCSALSNVNIPSSLVTIASYAFWYAGITSLVLPNSIQTIEECACTSCLSLKTLSIPSNIISLGNMAFNGCTNIQNLTCNTSIVTQIPHNSVITVIFNGGTAVPDYALYEALSSASYLTSVTLPDSITSIGSYAFRNCTSLTSINLPDSITSIGSYAFYNCTSLEEIILPKDLITISDYMFRGCTSLRKIGIGNAACKFNSYCFANCNSLSITKRFPTTDNSLYGTLLSDVDVNQYAFNSSTNITLYVNQWPLTTNINARATSIAIFTKSVEDSDASLPGYAYADDILCYINNNTPYVYGSPTIQNPYGLNSDKTWENPTEFSVTISGTKTVKNTMNDMYNFMKTDHPSSNKNIDVKWINACVPSGTIITLADRTVKKVEDLCVDDDVLTYDFYTGRQCVSKVYMIYTDSVKLRDVLTLNFSDGSNTSLIQEHGYFDVTTNKYEYINYNNYQNFIGHYFLTEDNIIRLESAEVTSIETAAYSPITSEHLGFYADGKLSITEDIAGLINIFDIDANTLKYDETKMQQDIDKYGLFTYEEFYNIAPIRKETFDAFNAKYFKIAIGKGILTIDKLKQLYKSYLSYNI